MPHKPPKIAERVNTPQHMDGDKRIDTDDDVGYKVYDVLRGQSSPCVQSSMDVISDSIFFLIFGNFGLGFQMGGSPMA